MVNIEASRNCAFGNGTRLAGFRFASVELKGENKLYQLLMELRKPDCKSVDDLETADVTLAEGVTKREFTMVLNNTAVMEANEPSGIAFIQEEFDTLKAEEAIEFIKQLDSKQRKRALSYEGENKKRKTVLEAFDGNQVTASKLVKIESLDISEDTKIALLSVNIETIGDFESYVDEHEGLDIDGLTDELTNELIAAIKLQLAEV